MAHGHRLDALSVPSGNLLPSASLQAKKLLHGGLILLQAQALPPYGLSSTSDCAESAISYIYKRMLSLKGTRNNPALDIQRFIPLEALGQLFSPNNIIASK